MIKNLIKNLTSDANYRYSWQSNIAMSFYDEVRRNKSNCRVSNKNLHKIANDAAINFLNILTRDNNVVKDGFLGNAVKEENDG